MVKAPSTTFTRWLFKKEFAIKAGEKGHIQFMCGGSRPFHIPDDAYNEGTSQYYHSVKRHDPNFIVDTLQNHVVKAFMDLDDRVIMRATRDPKTGIVTPWPEDHAAAVLKAKQLASLFHSKVLQVYYPDGKDLDLIVQGAEVQFLEELDHQKQRKRTVLLPEEADPDLMTLQTLPVAVSAVGMPGVLPFHIPTVLVDAAAQSHVSQQKSEPVDRIPLAEAPPACCPHVAARLCMQLPPPAIGSPAIMRDDDDEECPSLDYSFANIAIDDDDSEDEDLLEQSIRDPAAHFACEECDSRVDDPAPSSVSAAAASREQATSVPVAGSDWFWGLFKMGWHYACPGIPSTTDSLLQLRESFLLAWKHHPTLGGPRSVLTSTYGNIVDRGVLVKLGLRWPGSLKSKTCECVTKVKNSKGVKRNVAKPGCKKCEEKGYIDEGRPYWPFFRLDSSGRVHDIKADEVDVDMIRACILRLVPEPAMSRAYFIPEGAPRAVPATVSELAEQKRRGGKPVPVAFPSDAAAMSRWPKESIDVNSQRGAAIQKMIRDAWPEKYGELEAEKIVMEANKERFICVSVSGTNQHWCHNKDGEHPTHTVWFHFNLASQEVSQRCFCPCEIEAAKPRVSGLKCTDFKSERRLIYDSVLDVIFPKKQHEKCVLPASSCDAALAIGQDDDGATALSVSIEEVPEEGGGTGAILTRKKRVKADEPSGTSLSSAVVVQEEAEAKQEGMTLAEKMAIHSTNNSIVDFNQSAGSLGVGGSSRGAQMTATGNYAGGGNAAKKANKYNEIKKRNAGVGPLVMEQKPTATLLVGVTKGGGRKRGRKATMIEPKGATPRDLNRASLSIMGRPAHHSISAV